MLIKMFQNPNDRERKKEKIKRVDFVKYASTHRIWTKNITIEQRKNKLKQLSERTKGKSQIQKYSRIDSFRIVYALVKWFFGQMTKTFYIRKFQFKYTRCDWFLFDLIADSNIFFNSLFFFFAFVYFSAAK